MIYKEIQKRIKEQNGSFFANDNISQYLKDGELDILQKELESKFREILDILVIDQENDHNTKDTAKRVAKMMIQEVYKGRYLPMPKITEFPNAKDLDQIYTVGPITVRSACSHHMVPITGKAWIGVLPSNNVIGLSKFVRIAEWVMSRPQIQEEATIQLADILEQIIKPKGLAVVVNATHNCMTWRGVREPDTEMVTSVMRGVFLHDSDARAEFFRLIK